ncbi:MAG TPA: V-type ATP synthase subunit I [Acholeplasmataceae bacterium]|nr:V-type ATP synthase subunit I [Acholeplasmataceae bacterium]
MIVKMKKAKVFALKEYEDKLKRSLQRFGVLMITNENSTTHIADTQYEDSIISRSNRIVKELSKYEPKPSFFNPKFQIVDYDRFKEIHPEQLELLDQVEKTLADVSKLKEENELSKESITSFAPWLKLDVTTKDISNLYYVNIYLGQVLAQDVESFSEFLVTSNLEYEIYDKDANGVAYAIVSKNDISNDLKAAKFNLVELPVLDHSILDEVSFLQNKINENLETITNLEEKLKTYALSLDEIRLLSDQMLSEKELKKYEAEKTERTIYFEGWVREDQVDLLEKAVSKVTSEYEIDLRDPLPQENPPTHTKNNKFVAPFETITNMFSMPSYHEIDPNPVMSFWYWLFFGMMMGDWGYGVVMAIVFGLFLLIQKPKGDFKKLVQVLFYASIPSVIFGILYGSVFGISFDIGKALFGVPFKLFDPMSDPVTLLIVSLAVGTVHIFVALFVKAVRLAKEKDYLGILSDVVSWYLIIPGLVMLLVLKNIQVIAWSMVGVGALMILLFAGRDNKNFFKKITSGLGGLYGISGILSDILSYSRILALALSSGVIAFAMNIIGGLLLGPWYGYIFGVIVFIIGHIFNFAMGLLSAYVHDSRLQYIEFFGKFYDGGGYAFTPLKLQYNHIYEIEDNL